MDIATNLALLYSALLVINMGVTGVLWRQNGTVLNRDLFLTWAGWALGFVFQGLTSTSGPLLIALGFSTGILGNLAAGRVLAGIVGRQLPVAPLLAAWCAAVALACVAGLYGAPFWVVCLPISLTMVSPIAYAIGDGLINERDALTPAGRLLYLAGTAFVLHMLDFPFVRSREELTAVGLTLAVLVMVAMAITAPAVLLEKSTTERLIAEEQARAERSFFANVSHELRTPLTLILSPLENILTDKALVLPTHVRDYLAAMQRSTNRLLRLINNLLDLAKVDAGKVFLRYDPIDLAAFVTAVIPAFEPLAISKQIALHAEVSPVESVNVDGERLDIVMQNLLANALKFTSAGGSVVVRVGQASRHVWVEVQDTGIGIADKDLKVIFERFGQADASVTRRFGGSGIGLALVKELAELHGGTVAVKSVLGEGSTFRVSLPKGTAHIREDLVDRRAVALPVLEERRVARPTPVLHLDPVGPPKPAPVVSPQALLTAPRVLLVEDNAEMRNFLTNLLSQQYRVTVAVDGQEGLEKALELVPDLILSDVMMPRLSGYDLTKAVKADPRTKPIPVILLTAKRGIDPVLEGFEHGADDYLGKPFSTRELLARIKVQIDLRLMARQLAEFQKTSMMSTLAAGLAHEVRNPINAIVNGLPALRYFLPEAEPGAAEAPHDALFRVLEDSASRINTMIGELLDFANVDRAPLRPWDPNEGVASTLKLLGHRRNGQINVVTDYKFSGTVLGRAGPLNQVVMNLLDNAFRAVPDGGCVTVCTRKVDGGLELTVQDSGAGIAPDVLPRIFDPFFTTREVGVGTGLGLHLCKQIVQAHHGQLDATSAAGKGASFRVWIPADAARHDV